MTSMCKDFNKTKSIKIVTIIAHNDNSNIGNNKQSAVTKWKHKQNQFCHLSTGSTFYKVLVPFNN